MPVDPTDPTTPTDPATPTDPGTGSGTVDEAALQAALAAYQQALKDRQQAYADGDLVAAAQADQRMQDAVEAAIAATGG